MDIVFDGSRPTDDGVEAIILEAMEPDSTADQLLNASYDLSDAQTREEVKVAAITGDLDKARRLLTEAYERG